MRRVTIFFAALFICAGLAYAAQEILPSTFGGWSGTVRSEVAPSAIRAGERGSAAGNQEASALGEYGFVAGESGAYKKGAESLQVGLYKMKDPSGAYGLLTYLRAPEMRKGTFASHSFLSNDEALILAGNLVLDVRGKDLRRRVTVLRSLLRHVQAQSEGGALPTLWQELPAKRLISGTDRYVLGPRTLNQFFPAAIGDFVGFSNGAEAEVARYKVDGAEASLLLVDLPTPQIATQTLEQLAARFNVNGSKPGGSAPLFAKRLMTTLAIVAGAPTPAAAHALLGEVHSNEVLTWNQPVPKGKQADIYTIVTGTIIGTGIICAFSLIAGLAFGGLRLVIKKFMPGKVFDREKHMQVLQLGLSSKPISAEDFYDRSGPPIKMTETEKNLPEKTALRLFR